MRKHLIYNNTDMLTDDNIRQMLIENSCSVGLLEPKEVTDEEITEYKADMYQDYFDDEVCNLNVKLDGRVLAIANLGLWNGRAQGYKIGKANLNEVMTIGTEDYIDVYFDGYNIHKTAWHHDGTNYLTFREIREERNIDNLLDKIYNGEEVTRAMLNYYTKSLAPYIKQVYGW